MIAAFGRPQWGIFGQTGGPILVVDSVADVEYARDYLISDYSQEKGAFESYNKVQKPFQAKVSFLIGQTRRDFLSAVEAACASLDLVTVVTPEISYPSANLIRYGYRREARAGVTLIRVDVTCEEVRIISGVVPTNGQSTNSASTSQGGQVQGVPTTQNAPLATGGSVGGSFSIPSGTVLGSGQPTNFSPNPSSNLSTGLPSLIPAGVPNSTGGGVSATDTLPGSYIRSDTVGF